MCVLLMTKVTRLWWLRSKMHFNSAPFYTSHFYNVFAMTTYFNGSIVFNTLNKLTT